MSTAALRHILGIGGAGVDRIRSVGIDIGFKNTALVLVELTRLPPPYMPKLAHDIPKPEKRTDIRDLFSQDGAKNKRQKSSDAPDPTPSHATVAFVKVLWAGLVDLSNRDGARLRYWVDPEFRREIDSIPELSTGSIAPLEGPYKDPLVAPSPGTAIAYPRVEAIRATMAPDGSALKVYADNVIHWLSSKEMRWLLSRPYLVGIENQVDHLDSFQSRESSPNMVISKQIHTFIRAADQLFNNTQRVAMSVAAKYGVEDSIAFHQAGYAELSQAARTRIRKQESIRVFKELCASQPGWSGIKAWFERLSKQDDVADAALMAIEQVTKIYCKTSPNRVNAEAQEALAARYRDTMTASPAAYSEQSASSRASNSVPATAQRIRAAAAKSQGGGDASSRHVSIADAIAQLTRKAPGDIQVITTGAGPDRDVIIDLTNAGTANSKKPQKKNKKNNNSKKRPRGKTTADVDAWNVTFDDIMDDDDDADGYGGGDAVRATGNRSSGGGGYGSAQRRGASSGLDDASRDFY